MDLIKSCQNKKLIVNSAPTLCFVPDIPNVRYDIRQADSPERSED